MKVSNSLPVVGILSFFFGSTLCHPVSPSFPSSSPAELILPSEKVAVKEKASTIWTRKVETYYQTYLKDPIYQLYQGYYVENTNMQSDGILSGTSFLSELSGIIPDNQATKQEKGMTKNEKTNRNENIPKTTSFGLQNLGMKNHDFHEISNLYDYNLDVSSPIRRNLEDSKGVCYYDSLAGATFDLNALIRHGEMPPYTVEDGDIPCTPQIEQNYTYAFNICNAVSR